MPVRTTSIDTLSLVSVVIPLFNKGPYVERALSSALSQDHPLLEIIVVDDGSTDDGPERVRACLDPRVALVLNGANLGPGAARNRGLALARGRYIAFLDADDEWHPDFLRTATSGLEADPSIALACTGYEWRPAPPRGIKRKVRLEGLYEITASSSPALLSAIEVFTSLCFAVMRTATARRWGGYYEKDKCLRGEDQYFLLKLLLNERVLIIPDPHGFYHTDASSLCGRMSTETPTLEPCLSDPDELIAACPASKRALLREFLAARQLARIMLLARLGKKEPALDLINRSFTEAGRVRRMRAMMLRFIAAIAPAAPVLRARWRRSAGAFALLQAKADWRSKQRQRKVADSRRHPPQET